MEGFPELQAFYLNSTFTRFGRGHLCSEVGCVYWIESAPVQSNSFLGKVNKAIESKLNRLTTHLGILTITLFRRKEYVVFSFAEQTVGLVSYP